MEQEPSDQKPKGSIAHYLWLLSISVGLAIGAGMHGLSCLSFVLVNVANFARACSG